MTNRHTDVSIGTEGTASMCVARSQWLAGSVAHAIVLTILFVSPLAQSGFAQTARPQTNQQNVQNRQPRPNPAIMRVAKLDPMLERILEIWEWHGARTKKLEGKHNRIIYENTFGVMKLSKGEFYYESPDKGRIDIQAVKIPKPGIKKVGSKQFTMQSDTPEAWICDGTAITMVNLSRKEFQVVEIPPSARGQNIVDGPLPFLFGMKKEQAKKRYKLSLGKQNDPKKGVVHVVALPLWKQDAQQWSKAEVILNSKNFLPIAIQLTHPDGKDITVYKFSEVERNKSDRGVFAFWKDDPFKPNLKGFKQLSAIAEKPGTAKVK